MPILLDDEIDVTHYVSLLSLAVRNLKGKVCAQLKQRPFTLAFLYNYLSSFYYMALLPLVLQSYCKCNFYCIPLHIISGRSPSVNN